MLLAHSRTWALCFLLVATTACDVLVKEGETVSLGNGASFFGVDTPNAAFVLPEGTLIVENAILSGRGKVVGSLPAGPFPTPGAGIVAAGGIVDIRNGLVSGGNVLVTLGDPNGLPSPSSLAGPNVLAPALIAAGSEVSITGGTLRSSSVAGNSIDPYLPSPAMVATGSFLDIRGGSFEFGTAGGASSLNRIVDVSQSAISISGGSFAGIVQISSSNAIVAGGSFSGGLALGTLTPRALAVFPGCTEVIAGTFGFGIDVRGAGERVFIFGNDFDRGFGPVPATGNLVPISGVRLDGSQLFFQLFVGPGAQVVLASPDDTGCGFGS